jgi:hypothetical protein
MLTAYTNLLESFALHVGLDPQTLQNTQEVVIDQLPIGLLYEGEAEVGDLVYTVNLGAPMPSREAAVLRTLMQANHLWAGTGGCTAGLVADTGEITLSGRIDVAGVSAESLALLLDAFVDTAQFWERFVHDQLPSGAAAPAGASGAFVVRG